MTLGIFLEILSREYKINQEKAQQILNTLLFRVKPHEIVSRYNNGDIIKKEYIDENKIRK